MRLGSGIVLGLGVLLAGSAANAQTSERNLARGLIRMTLGALEVPGNMVAESDARGPGEELLFGA